MKTLIYRQSCIQTLVLNTYYQRCLLRLLAINPRPFSVFRHLRQWRGGGGTTPPGDRPLMVVELRGKKPVDASRQDLAIAYIVFNPRSTFDLVKSGQRSNFRENRHFWNLHAHSGKIMCRSDLKTSPACFPVQF